MEDPTKKEMLGHLRQVFPGCEPCNSDGDVFEFEEAIYWFASDWHSGQWSNLYSSLSTSAYCPGACSTGPEDPEYYNELERHFSEANERAEP